MQKKKKRRLKLAEPAAVDFGAKTSAAAIGSSGTDIIGGLIREEFLVDLQGPKAAQAYEKMRRREAQVAMLLGAITNPIISANWGFEVADEEDAQQKKMKELCEWAFKRGLSDGLQQHLREALTFIHKGFSVFEVVHATKNVAELEGSPLVTYFEKLGFRKQETIHRWLVERKTGKLVGVEQSTMGDTSPQALVTIPGEFLVVFTNLKEGDNYEGISALRAAYGAYSRKDLYLKLVAIGAERFAIGTVIGTTPKGKANTTEDAAFEEVLQAYATNECAFIKKPAGWEVEIQRGEFDPQKMVALLNFENEEMARSVVANFLVLGNGGNSGAYSLGSDLSDFFLGGIQSYANLICEVHNRYTIPALCKLNFGEQAKYPEMKCTGINDKAGKELAEIVLSLKNSGNLTPDDKLEEFLRAQYRLPKADPTTARNTTPGFDPVTGEPIGDPNAEEVDEDGEPKDNQAVTKKDAKGKQPVTDKKKVKKLAERAGAYKKTFEKNQAKVRDLMEWHVALMAANLKNQLRRNYEALGDKSKDKAVEGVAVKQSLINDYRVELRELMADIAGAAIHQARSEVPKARKVKFWDYDKLNPLVKKAIEKQLLLTATTQAADITKVVLFQFASSSDSRTNLDGILDDVDERVKGILAGTANSGMNLDVGAANATAHVTQNSRNSFFFEPEVLEQLESFTFFNEDPVSEICQNLNGQTFSVSDPDAEQFYPPLHHNCKSRLVPNEKGEGVKITGIGIKAEDTEERSRLAKQITFCAHDPKKA